MDMNVKHLLQSLNFEEKSPHAEALAVSENGRILRFTLRAGQSLREHRAPHAEVHLVVLQGEGVFSSEAGRQTLGPNAMVSFAAGEMHAVEALEEDLVFLAILQDVGRGK